MNPTVNVAEALEASNRLATFFEETGNLSPNDMAVLKRIQKKCSYLANL